MSTFIFRPRWSDPRMVGREPDWSAAEGVVDVEDCRERHRAMIDAWACGFEVAPSALERVLDSEDWSENAARFIAARSHDLPIGILEPETMRGFPVISRWIGGEPDPTCRPIFLGQHNRNEDPGPVAWPQRLSMRAPYWRSPIMLRALGRGAAVSSGNAEGTNGYVAVSRKLLRRGAVDLIAKIVFADKYQAPMALRLAADADEASIRDSFLTAFGYNLFDCDGRDECFLIQDRIEMRAEYRIVVVGGRPVSGAATIDALSPAFHDPIEGSFDPIVEGRRGDGALKIDRELVARYRRAAILLCDQLRAGGEDRFVDCTLDYATDGNGHEILVEANPAANFGLYACDFRSIVDTVVADLGLPHDTRIAASSAVWN